MILFFQFFFVTKMIDFEKINFKKMVEKDK